MYVANSGSADPVRLGCDTTESHDGGFLWQYSPQFSSGYNPVYYPQSEGGAYFKEGSGATAALNLGKENKDTSGFFCCLLFDGSPYKTYVAQVYAVLTLPANFQPRLEQSTGGMDVSLVSSGEQVKLKCAHLSQQTQLQPTIVPTVRW